VKWAMTLLLPLAMVSCVKIGKPEPLVRDYRLDYTPAEISGTPVPMILRVSGLAVGAVYDRESIVYRENDYATGTYFESRWSANPGSLVTDLLARDFAASRLYKAVQQGPSPLPSDYQLNGEIEEIEELMTGSNCAAHLRLRVTLVRTRRLAADPVALQKTYASDEASACNAPPELVASMSRAMARISAQLQRDVYEAIAADAAQHAARPRR
jgi:ABC-type uncharacterized transport system auxiliary subunit